MRRQAWRRSGRRWNKWIPNCALPNRRDGSATQICWHGWIHYKDRNHEEGITDEPRWALIRSSSDNPTLVQVWDASIRRVLNSSAIAEAVRYPVRCEGDS